MRKGILIALPILLVAVAVAFTHPDFDHKMRFPGVKAFQAGGFRLGIVLREINPHLKDDLKLDSGLLVEKVLPDSPADKAGIKEGDILLRVDGKAVSEPREVRELLQEMDSARDIPVELQRDGEKITVKVVPEKHELRAFMTGWSRNYIGVELQELDASLASYFNVKPDSGVLVVRVSDDSPAAKAGVQSGDVIIAFNGKGITSARGLVDELSDVSEGESGELTLIRHGKEMKLTVKPEPRRMPRIDIPDVDIPELSELPEREELRKEMEKLRKEVEVIRKEKLESLRNDIEQNVRKEMEKLRKELEELRKERDVN